MLVLSILILSIPRRIDKMKLLYEKLCSQIGNAEVEVLTLLDNKKRLIGEKRNNLLNIANGEYLTYIDDDDDVSNDYIKSILNGIEQGKLAYTGGADVITINERATINGGSPFIVSTGIENKIEPVRCVKGVYLDIKRPPWHWCVWRSSIAKSEVFPVSSWGEDRKWCEKLWPKIKSQFKIEKVLRYYTYDKNISEAPKQ